MIESANMEIKLNVKDVNKNLQHFDWIDYAVFLFMLISCAAVGVYFGFVDKKSKRRRGHGASNATEVAQEYLMGGEYIQLLQYILFSLKRVDGDTNFTEESVTQP